MSCGLIWFQVNLRERSVNSRFEDDVGHLRARAAGLVAQAVFATMPQIYERQPQIQRFERHKMTFVQVVNRPGLGKIQRAEINFLPPVFRLHQQRQPLSAADQWARLIDRTTIVYAHWAGDRTALSFAFYNLPRLFFDAIANWSGQSFDRRARLISLDCENGEMVTATSAASRAANQMFRVTRLKLRYELVHLTYEFPVRRRHG